MDLPKPKVISKGITARIYVAQVFCHGQRGFFSPREEAHSCLFEFDGMGNKMTKPEKMEQW